MRRYRVPSRRSMTNAWPPIACNRDWDRLKGARMIRSRIVAAAFLLSIAAGCGGDNDVDVATGPGSAPRPGTFRGTTSTGTDIAIDVGTIERVGFTCRDTSVLQVFSPPAPILDDGTFDVSFDA